MIQIDEDLCKGCEICINFCPKNVFDTSDKINKRGYYLPVVGRIEDCIYCKLCELLCPEFAIIITEEDNNSKEFLKSNIIKEENK